MNQSATRFEKTPQTINHIEAKRMATPKKEGKWKRRALSAATVLKDTGETVKDIVAQNKGKIAAGILVAALSQTTEGKAATQQIVDTGANVANAAIETGHDLLFGPNLANNAWAKEAYNRIQDKSPDSKNGERIAKHATTVSIDPSRTRIDVFPINSNFYEGTPVVPIGTIPVGTKLYDVLITPAEVFHSGRNDYSLKPNDPRVTGYVDTESWAATDCSSISSIFLDMQGNHVDNLSQTFPVCVIPEANIKLGK